MGWTYGPLSRPVTGVRVSRGGTVVVVTGGVASSTVSSSFRPALKLLIPLATSPITRGILPAPNRISTTRRTRTQCQALEKPISHLHKHAQPKLASGRLGAKGKGPRCGLPQYAGDPAADQEGHVGKDGR